MDQTVHKTLRLKRSEGGAYIFGYFYQTQLSLWFGDNVLYFAPFIRLTLFHAFEAQVLVHSVAKD